jgi:hypothetical protein
VPSLAHDPGRPELNGWFDKLASGRGLCCSLIDGVTIADPDWESKDGHYRVRLGGEWIDVPDDALVTVALGVVEDRWSIPHTISRRLRSRLR